MEVKPWVDGPVLPNVVVGCCDPRKHLALEELVRQFFRGSAYRLNWKGGSLALLDLKTQAYRIAELQEVVHLAGARDQVVVALTMHHHCKAVKALPSGHPWRSLSENDVCTAILEEVMPIVELALPGVMVIPYILQEQRWERLLMFPLSA